MQETANSKIEIVRFALDSEKETIIAALPKYQYYDETDGQVKDIKNLHKVYEDGGYEVRTADNADGSYSATVYNANGQVGGLKLYSKNGEPCTDMEKVAEHLGMKTDGFLNRLGAMLSDIFAEDDDSASILAELGENEYVRDRVVYRWNEESAQFDKVRIHYKVIGRNIKEFNFPPDAYFTLDEVVDNLTNDDYEKQAMYYSLLLDKAESDKKNAENSP